jgi:predicted NUDIX family NTP pyrophosphohydrolase
LPDSDPTAPLPDRRRAPRGAGRRSAGILLYRRGAGGLELLLVHPGGPFFARRDHGAWSIPKGEYEHAEDGLAAARREFEEELGSPAPPAGATELGEVRQKGGKLVRAWAIEGDLDASAIVSNTFTLEWPPRSGRSAEFPEIDRADWFSPDEARTRINPGQAPLVDRLERLLGGDMLESSSG